jgi:hypothetical protein
VNIANRFAGNPAVFDGNYINKSDVKSTSHPQSGWLDFSCCGTGRRQEKTEARMGFDVELAPVV